MASTVLQALSEPGRQVAIAAALGVSEATVSRLKNDHLQSFCELLAHAGLKIVAVESVCICPEKLAGLLTFAKAYLGTIENSGQLLDEGRTRE